MPTSLFFSILIALSSLVFIAGYLLAHVYMTFMGRGEAHAVASPEAAPGIVPGPPAKRLGRRAGANRIASRTNRSGES